MSDLLLIYALALLTGLIASWIRKRFFDPKPQDSKTFPSYHPLIPALIRTRRTKTRRLPVPDLPPRSDEFR